MCKGGCVTWALAAMLAAGTTLGQEKNRGAEPLQRAAHGWFERGMARLERTIERIEAKLSGRGGATMEGCAEMMSGGDMMSGGGMMGGSPPNERWRKPADSR